MLMHPGFKDELMGLMGTKQVKVPLFFIKGMLIVVPDEIQDRGIFLG